jgi:L,D-peptidoglycan transpeptidase YkuD (ErfK/YbiS/YcfS/YnhG family)
VLNDFPLQGNHTCTTHPGTTLQVTAVKPLTGWCDTAASNHLSAPLHGTRIQLVSATQKVGIEGKLR